ncbi:STAS domain-containing protein [Candidatus Oscillochloris fontis]|uniref:STAS domain-containing protein n=1 Tax=Candidatus Oscillochloris fontis TaxID=2496868 RepID=UPI0013759630|nr:STAS domain-containing protein [Candidatus Oscillochloris fontis]
MLQRLHTWLYAVTMKDPLEQRQSFLVQTFLLALIGVSLLALPLPFLTAVQPGIALGLTALVLIELPLYILALVVLRRGHFTSAIILTSVSVVVLCTGILFSTGTRSSGATMFTFALPIIFAGLLAGGRGAFWSIGLSALGIGMVLALEVTGSTLVGFATPHDANIGGVMGGFLSVATVLGFFVARFGRTLRDTLYESLRHEQEVAAQRDALEAVVDARTAELRSALAEVETRMQAQAEMLEEISQQREAIRELSVPLLPVDAQTLVLPLVGALDSARLDALQGRTLDALEGGQIRRLIMDVSGVPLVDSQVALGLLNTVRAARLLGVLVTLAGIRPEVAQAMVGLGLEMDEVRTFHDLEDALRYGR